MCLLSYCSWPPDFFHYGEGLWVVLFKFCRNEWVEVVAVEVGFGGLNGCGEENGVVRVQYFIMFEVWRAVVVECFLEFAVLFDVVENRCHEDDKEVW